MLMFRNVEFGKIAIATITFKVILNNFQSHFQDNSKSWWVVLMCQSRALLTFPHAAVDRFSYTIVWPLWHNCPGQWGRPLLVVARSDMQLDVVRVLVIVNTQVAGDSADWRYVDTQWISEWTNERIVEWMNEWINQSISQSINESVNK